MAVGDIKGAINIVVSKETILLLAATNFMWNENKTRNSGSHN